PPPPPASAPRPRRRRPPPDLRAPAALSPTPHPFFNSRCLRSPPGAPRPRPRRPARCSTVANVLSVEDARERILSRVAPLGSERVDVMGALGRVLAEPIVSRATIPQWPNSSMDGYALRAQDTNGGPVGLAVVGRIAAGTMPSRPLGAG